MKVIKPIFLFFVSIYLNNNIAQAQNDSTNSKWNTSLYAEIYYGYDFAKPVSGDRPSFVYNHKRHNEINANIVVAKASYADDGTRANFAAMVGNYAQYNLSAEPVWAQFVNEANIGARLSNKKNIWLDAGIFSSHIGFESAIGMDNATLTRSLCAETTPYFETGARLSFTSKNNQLYAALFALNGWQTVQTITGTKQPQLGMQLTYTTANGRIWNYSNFYGSSVVNTSNSTRFFQNFYTIGKLSNSTTFTTGFDIGYQQYNASYAFWMSPVAIVKYAYSAKKAFAVRVEYLTDQEGLVTEGFENFGTSVGYDYAIQKHFLLRTEAKMYKANYELFENNSDKNYSLTAALCWKK